MQHLLAFLLLFSISSTALASDHIDGPVTKGHAVTDLSDLFVFRTPGKPNHLSLALNTLPAAYLHNHFPDRAEYSFYLRKAAINGSKIDTGEEVKITCTFVTPDDHSKHAVTCNTSNGLSATNFTDKTTGSKGDFKIFAGLRSDPFFFDAPWTIKLSQGILTPPVFGDSMNRINILSIVIEIETKKLFQDVDLLAVASDVKFEGTQLDFLGRPEVTNIGMQVLRGPELRDRYNQEEAFSRAKEFKSNYRARLKSNLSAYDNLDGTKNLSEAKFNAIIEMLMDDYLVIDVTKPCVANGYFAIEAAVINGTDYTSCGGRHPNDDVMDQIFTLFVTGNFGPTLEDGTKFAFGDKVDAPHKKVNRSFPYLAAPSTGNRAKLKAKAFRKLFDL